MAVAGTPMYFAPEVASRFCDVDSTSVVTDRSDVFALALALAHCVSPPDAASLAGVDFEAFVSERSQEVPKFNHSAELAPVAGLLERWLHFDGQERPTAAELANEIADVRRGEDASGKARGHKRRGTGSGRTRQALWLVLSLALAASAYVLGGHLSGSTATPPSSTETRRTGGETDLITQERDDALLRATSLEEQLGELRSQLLFGDVEDRNRTAESPDAGERPDSAEESER